MTDENAGSVWPEQEVIDKWFKEQGIKVSHKDSMSLKRAVTDIRLEVQTKLDVAEGRVKTIMEDRSTDAEKLITLADRCSDLVYGGECGWEQVEFKDFVDCVAKRLRYNPDNDNPWIVLADELPVIPEGKYGMSVIVAYIDPYNAQEVDEYCTEQISYHTRRDTNNPEGFYTLAYGPKEAEWMFFEFEITHWRYCLKHPLDK